MKLKGIALLTILLIFSGIMINPYLPKGIRLSIPNVFASSIVQSKNTSCNSAACSSSIAATFGSGTTNGNLLIVGIMNPDQNSISSITDTAGYTFTSRVSKTGTTTGITEIWTAPITGTSADKVTVSYTAGTSNAALQILEVSGATTTGLQTCSTNTQAAPNACTSSITIASTDFVFAIMLQSNSHACTPNSGYTTTGTACLAADGLSGAEWSISPSNTGTQTNFWAVTTTPSWFSESVLDLAVGTVTQPVKATRTAGTVQQTITVSGCSVSPTTYAGDGSGHNLVASPTCSLTNTLPAGFDWNTTGTRTWSFTTCASGTCATQSNTYTSHPIINQTTSCFFLAASSGTCTFSKVVSVGHDIVVGTVDSVSSIGVTSVTDNGSAANTYHLIVSKSTQALAGDTEEWFAPVTSAATHIKVTVNWGSSINGGIILYDLAIASNDIPDDFSSGSALSSTAPTVTAYLPDANSMVIGVLNSACITTCTITAGPGGYTLDNNHGIGSTLQGSSESNRSIGASETTPFAASSASAYNEVSLAVLFPGQTVSLTVALKLSITGLPTHSIPFYTINQTLPKERNNFTLYCDNAGVNTSTQLLTSSTSGITCDQATGVTITGKASLSNESIEWVFNNVTTFVRFEANPNSTSQSATYYYYCLFNYTQYIENNPTGTLSYSTAPATSGSTDNPQISKKSEANGLVTIWPRLGSNSTNFVVASTSTSSTTTTTATTTTTTFSNTTTTTTTSFTTTTFSNTTITSTTTTTTVHSNSTITNTLGPIQGYPTILDGIGIVAAIFLGAIVILRKKGEPPQT